MTKFVGAQHEFHDSDFARGWADRFVPTEPRLRLFDMILGEINALDVAEPHILELGVGPGYMARHILERHATATYEALDFSEVFFDIARVTIGDAVDRVTFTNADLLNQSWPSALSRQPDAIVSTWALHDLGGRQLVADVYARCHETLPEHGVLVNGDFIKPDGTDWEFEPGRFEIGIHLDMMRQVGFPDPKVLAHLEASIENPTAAENYACLVARR